VSVTTPCPENIPSEMLSAWGDGGLPEAEAARLRAHAAGCPACQERLRAFSDVSQLVRGQRIPPAPPVDLAAIGAGQRRPGATHRLARRGMPRTLWGGLGAAVAAALLITAFSQVFAHLNHVTPIATVTPATTATPTSKLAWAERTLPPGLTLTDGGLVYAFSPVDDQAAWICAQASDGSFIIWATADQARSWRIASRLTQRLTSARLLGCELTPDSANPHVLALSFNWGCGACGTLRSGTYISGDSGATWRAMPGDLGIWSLATIGARTYALIYDSANVYGATSLLLSDNGLASWRKAGPSAAPTNSYYLWPNLTTGALLLGDGSNHLWRTENGGASWTEITLSRNIQVGTGEGAWLPSLGAWRICGQQQGVDPTSAPILCTTDLGKTWTSQPYLNQVDTCQNCAKGGGSLVTQQGCFPMAMTPDGSLYSWCQLTTTVTQGQTPVGKLYRLAPGAAHWESLGAPPSIVSHPFATPQPGNPVDGPSQVIGALLITGDSSHWGTTVWYSDPLRGILVVAALPS
jgi:putative zinc finger protein